MDPDVKGHFDGLVRWELRELLYESVLKEQERGAEHRDRKKSA